MDAKKANSISREIIYGVASGTVHIHELRRLVQSKMPSESQQVCDDLIEAEIRAGRLVQKENKLSLTQAGIDRLFNLVDIK